jgi:hypothetical protein
MSRIIGRERIENAGKSNEIYLLQYMEGEGLVKLF